MSGLLDSLRGKKILVIEDEAAIRRFYDRLFRRYELETVFAPTGSVAMEIIESGQSFDAILLDIRLPGLSGRELWKLLEIKRPELCSRVIMVTGDILTEATRQLLEESHRPYLEKPFSTEVLLSLIAEIANAAGDGPSSRNQVIGE